ncbi:SAM-dependent methyltransferase [Lewinella marina]|uniref:SAM-dependent methyltransferase n=1 Tax=Neolewinella marina TaxID=438751 RepID=A0A2G0CB65_9BACT|nr:class I SAM-dependent methyltransferase [Neolewinella marina]NJB86823.1 SAM-dependent methyltransferase [Neolewinella marina]PHK97167.1 SAM-dependent methyltransferase [Neolewinella marina]
MDPLTLKIRQTYDQLAADFDAHIDDKPHNAYYDRPNTLSLLPEVEGKHVLDAGCGPGKYAEILLERGARVTGCDLSPRMVELARRRNPNGGTFFVHDLANPLEMLGEASCDVVLCALALHYLRDWGPTIREFHRVLRPGGCLVLSLEHPFFDYGYYNSGAYFDTEEVTATWTGFGTPVEMPGYRRPLQACITPLTENGFYLDRLLEPRPVPEFEQHDPKHFRELNAFPAFMMLRGVRG